MIDVFRLVFVVEVPTDASSWIFGVEACDATCGCKAYEVREEGLIFIRWQLMVWMIRRKSIDRMPVTEQLSQILECGSCHMSIGPCQWHSTGHKGISGLEVHLQ
jgi:hypothetical protein